MVCMSMRVPVAIAFTPLEKDTNMRSISCMFSMAALSCQLVHLNKPKTSLHDYMMVAGVGFEPTTLPMYSVSQPSI